MTDYDKFFNSVKSLHIERLSNDTIVLIIEHQGGRLEEIVFSAEYRLNITEEKL